MKKSKKIINRKKELAQMLTNTNDGGLALVFDLKTFGTASYVDKMNVGSILIVMADLLKDLAKNYKEREFVARKIAEKLGVELPKIETSYMR